MANPSTSIRYQTVLFDLDGTLIDHFQIIYRCYQYAMEKLGLESVDFDTVLHAVGGSIPITFGKLVPQECVEPGVAHFREHFDRIWHEEINILPGTEWLLKNLRAQGVQMAVFTNKDGGFARKIIDHVGLSDHFELVIGARDTDWRKPQPEFTLHVLQQLGADSAESCMVGDSPYDAQAAEVVNMDRYLVATGSHSLDQLKTVNAQGAFTSLYGLGATVFNLRVPAEAHAAE